MRVTFPVLPGNTGESNILVKYSWYVKYFHTGELNLLSINWGWISWSCQILLPYTIPRTIRKVSGGGRWSKDIPSWKTSCLKLASNVKATSNRKLILIMKAILKSTEPDLTNQVYHTKTTIQICQNKLTKPNQSHQTKPFKVKKWTHQRNFRN